MVGAGFQELELIFVPTVLVVRGWYRPVIERDVMDLGADIRPFHHLAHFDAGAQGVKFQLAGSFHLAASAGPRDFLGKPGPNPRRHGAGRKTLWSALGTRVTLQA